MIKAGRFGEFVACSGYPGCKHSRHIRIKTGVRCPGCKTGELVEKKVKGSKKAFYGCDCYPDCHFTVNDKPVPEACPRCGGLQTDRGRGRIRCILCDPPKPFWEQGKEKATGSRRPTPTKTTSRAGGANPARRGSRQR